VCPKHVELIVEINKTVIVAYSWSSIFTLPKKNDVRKIVQGGDEKLHDILQVALCH
jgi:hypothetical protein